MNARRKKTKKKNGKSRTKKCNAQKLGSLRNALSALAQPVSLSCLGSLSSPTMVRLHPPLSSSNCVLMYVFFSLYRRVVPKNTLNGWQPPSTGCLTNFLGFGYVSLLSCCLLLCVIHNLFLVNNIYNCIMLPIFTTCAHYQTC